MHSDQPAVNFVIMTRGGPDLPIPSLADVLRHALAGALGSPLRIPPELAAMSGMSGVRYRQLLNDLVRLAPTPRYLEIGSWKGSTLCSAIAGNTVRAQVIDNWSLFDGPSAEFLANLSRFKGRGAQVSIIEDDFRAVDYTRLGRFNIYMFDGPHEEQDHFDGLAIAQPALDDEYIFMVDDWNWPGARNGTRRALATLGLQVNAWVEIRTTLNDTRPLVCFEDSEWHNGYLLAVLRKPPPG